MGLTVSPHAQRELWEKKDLLSINFPMPNANASHAMPTVPKGEIDTLYIVSWGLCVCSPNVFCLQQTLQISKCRIDSDLLCSIF